MKTTCIEFRRYSDEERSFHKAHTDDPVLLAEAVGKKQLRGRSFTHLFVTPLRHTGQTLTSFARSAGDFPNIMPGLFQPYMRTGRTSKAMKLWNCACAETQRHNVDALASLMSEHPQDFHDVAIASARTFDRWLNGLPRVANVLVVGHSPFLEMIAYGTHRVRIPQLQPCDGFRIHVDENDVRKLITGMDSPDLIAANTQPWR